MGVVFKFWRALRAQILHNPTIHKFLDPPLVAAAKGHLHIIKYLINEQRCDPLCCDKMHTCNNPLRCNVVDGTPLHWAAGCGELNVVKYFVEDLKCPPNIPGHNNTTPLEEAQKRDHSNVVQYLMSVVGK